MPKLQLKKDVTDYITKNIHSFHERRISSIDNLQLKKVLKRKNPYLFRAKFFADPEQIVKAFVDAHVSSNEETVFGDWLEGLAIFINGKVYGGWKSGITGVDLEFDRDGKRYIVSIKSGPNWGNSRQTNKMKDDFKSAKKTLRTSNSKIDVEAVNGCCYGKAKKTDKGDYYKYCGQRFWEFISGEKNLYIDIIQPLGEKAKQTNEAFARSYSERIKQLTIEFSQDFCDKNGKIDWEKIIRFNASSEN